MKAALRGTALLALSLAWRFPAAARAHAFLDHADPKVGSELDKAPSEVKIWFTEEIEPALSSIKVLDASGKQVDKKDFRLDSKDRKLAVVSLANLAAGTYKVVWQVVSTDTHKTQGDFTFSVKSAKQGGASGANPATTTHAAAASEPGPPSPPSNNTK